MFQQDQRLTESSIFIADLELCRLSLKNNKVYPWVVLVPRLDGIREIFELSTADQRKLVAEISLAARMLSELYQAKKINTAAYGNMVPQLHIHVFARFETDPAWPKPIWAVQTDEIPYTDVESAAAISRMRDFLTRSA